MNWLEIAGWAIAIIAGLFGGAFFVKWRQGIKLLREMGEAFTYTAEALEDHKLTKAELIGLLQEWLDIYNALRELLPSLRK